MMSVDPLISQQIGPYKISDRLGKGGMATVYRARQTTMGRDVAVKIMSEDLAEDAQFVARFEHEAQIIANLQHPRVLPVHDFGHEGDTFYLVMRLIEGETLFQRLARGALALPVAAHFTNQVAEALDYAHSQGVIHRDLKPNNILIDAWDNLYLMDFGLAKMLSASQNLTQTGAVLGTPAYMAPEQWRGEPVDARTDVYALGVILYEMVLGSPPFESETPYTLMYKHIHDAPPAPRAMLPDLPEAVEQVILTALAKNRDDRYHSAGALARALTLGLQAARVAGSDDLAPPTANLYPPSEAVTHLEAEIDAAQRPAADAARQEAERAEDVKAAAVAVDTDDADDAAGQPDAPLTPPQQITPPQSQPQKQPQSQPPPAADAADDSNVADGESVAGIPLPSRPARDDGVRLAGAVVLSGAEARRRVAEDGDSEITGALIPADEKPRRKRKPKRGLEPDGSGVLDWMDRVRASEAWQQAREAVEHGLEVALEKAAETAPSSEISDDGPGSTPAIVGGVSPNLPVPSESRAFQQVGGVLHEGEPLLGVLDVRGTPEWRTWQYLAAGGLVFNLLGAILAAGPLSALGVVAWVFLFVQGVRTWRGSIGRYYLGFTPRRLILMPRDEDNTPLLDKAQAAEWPVVDRLRLTGRSVMLDVPNETRKDFHFAALVVQHAEGGLGNQYRWLPNSPIVALLENKGFEVDDLHPDE